jgi:hypothetical protein
MRISDVFHGRWSEREEEEVIERPIPFPHVHQEEDGRVSAHDQLLELIIFAKENGADERPRLRRIIVALEQKAERSRERSAARLAKVSRCVRCEQRGADGLLCWACKDDAPQGIRHAFRLAVGLDGIREATRKVMAWAQGKQRRRTA